MSYSFFDSVRQLMGATHTALAGVSAAEKVSDLLDMDTSRPYQPDFPKEEEGYMGIRMEHVSHTYTGRNIALKDVSLTIQRGKVTALAGLSGCGKSTVAGLLMRFFDPAGGRIVLEGRDYISFTPEELRKHIIMVPQSVSIFAGTIADNLRMAKENASDEELLEALDQVRLKDWVLEQPDGLLTDVGDGGGKLSGGQRQKIGIARALLCQAEYIIFDEATSSVDVESEQEIWNCIDRLALTRTLIIISHRLSTIRNADCIYVLDGGEISESGRHDGLMRRHGLYHRLVTEPGAAGRQTHLEGQTRLEGQEQLEMQVRLEGQTRVGRAGTSGRTDPAGRADTAERTGRKGAAMMKRKFQYSIRDMTIRLLKIAAPVKAPLAAAPLQVLWEIFPIWDLWVLAPFGSCLRGQAGLGQSCAVWDIDGQSVPS